MIAVLGVAGFVAGCGGGGGGTGATSHGTSPTPTGRSQSAPNTTGGQPSGGTPQAAALKVHCLQITDAQAAQILGVPGPYTTSGNAKYPCPAFWESPVKWEEGDGPDKLHGTLSDAAVSVEYIDFADSPAARAEYDALHAAGVKEQVDNRGVKSRQISPVDASGDAEAYLDIPVPSTLEYAYGSQLISSLIGRCGSRLLRVNASKDTFYSAVMDGHLPSEQNIVQRSRLPVTVQTELRKAYSLLGQSVCNGEELPSILIGPYTRVGA